MERARRRELSANRRRIVADRAAAAILTTISLCAALVVFSCQKPGKSFNALLARIDAAPGAIDAKAFAGAAAMAGSTEERLRLMKRASARDTGLAASTASIVMEGGAVAEPVALAALDAFLESGRFAEALALFDGPLKPANRGAEYAEAISRAAAYGYRARATMEGLVACADASGDRRFMIAAAVDAMAAGDRASAALILTDRSFDPDAAPFTLLWDSGAITPLADRQPKGDDPLEMAVCADASFLSGRIAAAANEYAAIIERYPSWSWKPYAAIARASSLAVEREPESGPVSWPHTVLPGSSGYYPSGADMTARWYALMETRFPRSEPAMLERSRWLASTGRRAEAFALIKDITGPEAAICRLQSGPLDRAVPDAMRLAADYADSPAIVDEALAVLAKAGAWEQFEAIAAAASKGGSAPARLWFWEALAAVLNGDVKSAAESIRGYGPGQAGYAGAVDLGILELAASRAAAASEAFAIAVGLADTDERKSMAYVFLGDADKAAGDLERARSAYGAALGLDPSSRIARSRIERLGTGK